MEKTNWETVEVKLKGRTYRFSVPGEKVKYWISKAGRDRIKQMVDWYGVGSPQKCNC